MASYYPTETNLIDLKKTRETGKKGGCKKITELLLRKVDAWRWQTMALYTDTQKEPKHCKKSQGNKTPDCNKGVPFVLELKTGSFLWLPRALELWKVKSINLIKSLDETRNRELLQKQVTKALGHKSGLSFFWLEV